MRTLSLNYISKSNFPVPASNKGKPGLFVATGLVCKSLIYGINFLLIIILQTNFIYGQETPVTAGHMLSVSQGLQSPVRIAIDKQDIIYVTDASQKRILRYDTIGNFLGIIEPGGKPISIAINDKDQVFIGDAETGAILKIDKNGMVTEFFTEIVFPSSMTFGADQYLYVVDSKLKHVVVLDTLGQIVRTIGDGTLVLPTGIAYDHINNYLYVSEHGGIGTGFKPLVKIWIFDLQGDLINSFGSHGNGDGQFYRIQGLAVGECGNIYAIDPFQATVSIFDEAGFVTKFGEYGKNPAQLNAPMDMVIDSRNRIWITCMNNATLEVYNINETKLSATITSANTSICSGETTEILFNFTGTAPWTFTYTVDEINPVTVSSTDNNPYVLTVSEAGNYKVTALSDANSVATCFPGSIDISINPLPLAQFTYSENQLELSFSNNSVNADSYYWNFDDQETSNEINPVHVYEKPGEYKVVLTAYNEKCGSNTFSETISIMGTAVKSINSENFVKFYPNPSNGKITIEINNPEQSDLRLEITNISGQIIFSKVYKMQKVFEQIDLSTYSNGIYTIKFITNTIIKTDKIIINK